MYREVSSTRLRKDNMEYYVYIIQSEKTGKYYIGSSADPELRLKRHNDRWTQSTKKNGPWVIVHKESCGDKSEALKREKQIKSWKSKKAIKDLIRKP